MNNDYKLIEFLEKHAGKKPVSFHMPGHKGSGIFRRYGYNAFLENFMDMDVTEIPGADNLFATEGVLKELQERYARLYGARSSWLMVNGTSGALIASILATVPRGGKIIMARNCHKSVFNGVRLAGAIPIYARPELLTEYGISGQVTWEEIRRCVSENPDAAAILITSPNYYGICSDIAAIAEIARDAGMILIVDQAHGAHLKFFEGYSSAEEQGADIVANSTHKTLASMTQSAILNLCTDRVSPEIIEDQLQIMESSSPSYVLMASLDINARIVEEHGIEVFKEWQENLEYFYGEAAKIPGLELIGMERGTGGAKNLLDPTKINMDFGIHGLELEEKLNERGIFPELVTGNILMCMTGIGNTRADYDALLAALREIGAQCAAGPGPQSGTAKSTTTSNAQPLPGKLHHVPASRKKIKLTDAAGSICAVSIIPYPPGSPLVCPGEEITQEIVDYVKLLKERGEKVMGVDEDREVIVGA